MRAQTLSLSIPLCAALSAGGAWGAAPEELTTSTLPLGNPGADWSTVPEAQLSRYYGGLDMGPLVASFAIQRLVEVDGVVVARMQLVISNLDNLGNGGAPTVTLSGPAAQLVQVMNATGSPEAVAAMAQRAAGEAPGAALSPKPDSSDTLPLRAAASAGATTHQITSTVQPASSGNGMAAASPSAAATPLASAPPAASAGAAATVPSAAGSMSGSSPSASGVQSVTAHSMPVVVMPATLNPAGGSDSGLTTTKTVALGNTGKVAVLANLPNAPALTTAIQNQVNNTIVTAQTTISATINSIGALNALNLASQIQQQTASGH